MKISEIADTKGLEVGPKQSENELKMRSKTRGGRTSFHCTNKRMHVRSHCGALLFHRCNLCPRTLRAVPSDVHYVAAMSANSPHREVEAELISSCILWGHNPPRASSKPTQTPKKKSTLILCSSIHPAATSSLSLRVVLCLLHLPAPPLVPPNGS